MSTKSIIQSAGIAAAFAGFGHVASADPADERSLPHLIADLESAGLSQSYLTNGTDPSFVTLGDETDCRIVVEQVGNQTYFRPSEDCDCDETIGTPHRSPIESGAFTQINPSAWLVERFSAVGIIDGATREIVFVPKQSCEQGDRNQNSTPGGGGTCGGCNGGGRPDRGSEPGGP